MLGLGPTIPDLYGALDLPARTSSRSRWKTRIDLANAITLSSETRNRIVVPNVFSYPTPRT